MAEAPTSEGSLQRPLECSVCLHIYDLKDRVPMGLYCMHTFCKRCVDTLAKNPPIKCPKCERSSEVEALCRNFSLCDVLEKLCQACGSREMVAECDHCRKNLCSVCLESHVETFADDVKQGMQQLRKEVKASAEKTIDERAREQERKFAVDTIDRIENEIAEYQQKIRQLQDDLKSKVTDLRNFNIQQHKTWQKKLAAEVEKCKIFLETSDDKLRPSLEVRCPIKTLAEINDESKKLLAELRQAATSTPNPVQYKYVGTQSAPEVGDIISNTSSQDDGDVGPDSSELNYTQASSVAHIPSHDEKQFGKSQSCRLKLGSTTALIVDANSGDKPPSHNGKGVETGDIDKNKHIPSHDGQQIDKSQPCIPKLGSTAAFIVGPKSPNSGDKPPSHKGKGVETGDTDENKELFRKLRSILNKMTPQKFQKLLQQAIDLGINTEDKLAGCVDVIFEKAISEPNYSVAYANFCKCFSNLRVRQKSNPEQFVGFRELLLNRCQKEFERDKTNALDLEKMQHAIDAAPAEKKDLIAGKDLAELKAGERSLGNIRFIGELFKLRMLTEGVIHHCLLKLLRVQDDDNVEAVCILLTTTGEYLDKKSKQRMDQYFSILTKLVESKQHSSRLRFVMLDVIDLRENDWVPRREDNVPKTIEQIHKEARLEEQ